MQQSFGDRSRGPTSFRRQPERLRGTITTLDLEDFPTEPTSAYPQNTPTSGQRQQTWAEDSITSEDLERLPTLQTMDDPTDHFESTKTHYIYLERQHDLWTAWWEKTPGFKHYSEKYAGKRRVRWNSNARGAQIWKYYRQCATRFGKHLGYPNIECILCSIILAHPSAAGTTSMHDHNKSMACKKVRQKLVIRDGSTPTLEELWRMSGTKVSKFHTCLINAITDNEGLDWKPEVHVQIHNS